MTVSFDNPKHEELANDYEKLTKWCAKKTTASADEVLATLDYLLAAPSLQDLPHVLHPHPLAAEYKGCFGAWVNKKERIIFRPDPDQDPPAIIYNYKTVKSIQIVEICKDYHKG